MSSILTPTELWAKVVLQNKLLTPEKWAEALALHEELGGETPIGQLLVDNGYMREEIAKAVDKKVTAVHAQLVAAGASAKPSPVEPPKRKSAIPTIEVEPEREPGSQPPSNQENISPAGTQDDSDADPNEAPGITGGQTALGSSLSIGGSARREVRQSKPLQIPVDGDDLAEGEKGVTEEDLMPKNDGDHWNPSDADWIDDVSVNTKARAEHHDVEQIDLVEDDPAAADPASKPKILRQDDASWANNATPAIPVKRSADILQIDMDAPEEKDDPMVPKVPKKIIHRDAGPSFK